MDPEVRPQRPLAKQFVRYASVSVIGTAVHFLIYIGLVESGFRVVPSSAAAFIISALSNYWLNYHYTFSSGQTHRVALIKFCCVALVGLLLNTLIIFTLDRMNWHYLLAQVAAAIVVLAWNFAANRLWTFGGD